MTDKNEIVLAEVVEEKAMQAVTPMDLIQRGMDQGTAVADMTALFDLQLRYEENEAKKAYHKAVAAFKVEAIIITKDKQVGYKNKDGSFTGYTHASIGNVVSTIIPFLAKHGLSHAWDVNQDSGIKVTCTLTHELGYSTSVSMSAGKDDSGKKNAIQQVSSTVTYLQRYTLFASTGFAAIDQEDDDGSSSEEKHIEYITESQVMDIDSLLAETGADTVAFYEYMTIKCKFLIEDVAQIPAEFFAFTVKVLENKRGK